MRSLPIERERQSVVFAIDAVPNGVRLDPELRVWRVLGREALPPILRQWMVAKTPRLGLVSSDPQTRDAAHALAQRFFERPAQSTDLSEVGGSEPLLVVGLHEDVDAALRRLGLPARPANLSGRGSAQVWTIFENTVSTPVAVVSARDAASLAALQRPLPHYGAQSYVILDGSRVIERGVWPAASRLIPIAR
jgi:hypothetical protein